jgi:fatty-acyl-CoA synthase
MGGRTTPTLETLCRFYNGVFDRYGNRTAIRTDRRRISYETFDERTRRLANFFHTIGLGAGDAVGILMKNRVEFLTSLIAAARAGVVAVPLNGRSNTDRLRVIFRDLHLEALIVGPELADLGHELQQGDLDIKYFIGVGDDTDRPLGFHEYESIFERADDDLPPVQVQPDDVAGIYFTSGTTGEPKGTLHTHESLVRNLIVHFFEMEITYRERLLLVTPLGHSAGLFAMAALASGGTIFLEQEFEPETVVRRIENDDISWTYLVPSMLTDLLTFTDGRRVDTASLDTLAYGSGPLSVSTLRTGIETFGDVFIGFYGLTEVPNLVTVLPKSRHDTANEVWLRSVGRPCRQVEVTVFEDENDWSGDIGEIGIRSAYEMQGYLRDDHDLTGRRQWIRTGDLGRIDDEGRVFVFERMEDSIIVDGEPVFSTDIESVIEQRPDITRAAVIGVPADPTLDVTPRPERTEQRIKAVVVPADGSEPSPATVQTYCAERLPEREVPDSVDRVDALPETPYGQIDKQLLREPYW